MALASRLHLLVAGLHALRARCAMVADVGPLYIPWSYIEN